MPKLSIITILAIAIAALVTPTAQAKSCGIYYVSHTSHVTGHTSMRHVYRCSK